MTALGAGPSTLYWYMTNTCNQRCAHCWVTAGSEFGQRAVRLHEILDFLDDAVACGLRHVKMTGGEPMIYRDFRAACDYFDENDVAVWLETNGIRIDRDWASYFATIGAQVGLSLDDVNPKAHDDFRGRDNSWQYTVDGARLMIDMGVSVGFTSCLTESNLHTMERMTSFLLEEVGAEHVAFNPIIPFGRAKDSSEWAWGSFLDEMLDRYERLVPKYTRERIILNLPVAFTTSAMHQQCMLGDDIISILSDGSISICGFGIESGEAIRFGDARTDLIRDLWHTHPGIVRLRTPGLTRLKGICANCVFSNTCRGYCRAVALAEYGDVDAPYPVCQHFADQGRFPKRYLIDDKRDTAYEPSKEAREMTADLLPKSPSSVRTLLPIVATPPSHTS